MGVSSQRVLQFGREATYGTPVAAAAILSGVEQFTWDPGITLMPMTFLDGTQTSNQKIIKVAEMPLAVVNGLYSAEDSIYWLDSAFNLGVITGAGPWTHVYSAPVTTAAQAVRSRTLEFYDGNQEYRMTSALVDQFTIAGDVNSLWKFSTNWFGAQIVAGTLTAALSTRAFNPFPTTSTSIWIDDIGGTIGTTAISATLISWSLQVQTGLHGKFFQNGTLLRSAKGINNLFGTLNLTLEAGANGVAEIGKLLAGTGRLIRIKSATTNTAFGQIDFCGAYTNNAALWGNRDGNTTLQLTLSNQLDTGAFANWLKITNQNSVSALVAAA